MSDSIDSLTISYQDNGTETVRELDKQVLTRGAWTTIIFRYQDWEPAKNAWSPVRFSIRRYQKRNDQYWQKSKFNISSTEQARKIIDVLNQWLEQEVPE
ncbi:hypothetical protein Lgee_0804 [Legionella geestiana]|uniref:Uncharacterized protein n=1 Tax=Legionella geestiana TaxID=45065 RepID=A0A0W0U2C9_9GAMM|nr:hypothetical protein [Legionella geestiana]KTD02008.1 hypothetical protein Lgee_0804 [Legionella geestiana]QBS12050.1 hypothetical protein E4T54_04450 [Legionella geestiana]QDQ40340.1 hypothetical protein E3226_007990 [Legionella geestiana]STX53230.1 Uncharacterised protein [Legionella geestiana]